MTKQLHFLSLSHEESPIRFVKDSGYVASGPITSWEIDGETMETVTDFIFMGSKITVGGDCSHEMKRCSLEGKL